MNSKKKSLKNSHLYCVIDRQTCKTGRISHLASELSGNNAQIIQLRDKCSSKKDILDDAFVLQRLLAKTKAIFIVNDYVDIAYLTGADGVHLGQGDLTVEAARKILGKDKIIGLSCHSLRQAVEAEEQGADYIGIGPIFPTSTKPGYEAVGLDLLRQCSKKIRIPFFAIGGITLDNLKAVLKSGAKRVAVCSAVCAAKDPGQAARSFCKILHSGIVQARQSRNVKKA
jgi:thiamine-phosphate pyrophosphorylase